MNERTQRRQFNHLTEIDIEQLLQLLTFALCLYIHIALKLNEILKNKSQAVHQKFS